MSDLDAYGEVAWMPEGPTPGSDLRMTTTAVVVAVDVAGSRVQAAYKGGAGIWLPAIPAIYTPGQTCTVLLNPLRGGRGEIVLGPVQGQGAARTATLVSMNTAVRTAVVTMDGVTYPDIPYVASTYTVGTLVWVLRNPARWGAPEIVLGAWAPAVAPTPPPTPGPIPIPPAPPGTQQVTTTIFPQWSGSYRAGAGWDRWNTGRFGGRSDLYQGNAFGSGVMTGLACFGDQLANLGAISIDVLSVALIPNGATGVVTTARVQGSPNGAPPPGAPAVVGATTTGPVGSLALPASTREDMRTGAVKALVLNGTGYLAVRGTSHPEGMALTVTYTRSA